MAGVTKSPFQLPPGPERRELMARMGLNTSPYDYTDAELAAAQVRIAELQAAWAQAEAERDRWPASRPGSPYSLPPGPERRTRMRELGLTLVARTDYTDEEWEALVAAPPPTPVDLLLYTRRGRGST